MTPDHVFATQILACTLQADALDLVRDIRYDGFGNLAGSGAVGAQQPSHTKRYEVHTDRQCDRTEILCVIRCYAVAFGGLMMMDELRDYLTNGENSRPLNTRMLELRREKCLMAKALNGTMTFGRMDATLGPVRDYCCRQTRFNRPAALHVNTVLGNMKADAYMANGLWTPPRPLPNIRRWRRRH